jgi:glycosyltransferase involved in cell wall biosynthesis
LEQERSLLAAAGHDVTVHSVSNFEVGTFRQKAGVALRTAYNPEQGRIMAAKVASLRPEVVHVHNFFPLLSPAVHEAAREGGAAVVQTLHNYRMICAAATLARNGKVCELCLKGSRLNALRYRCYRGSLVGTAALVNLQRVNARDQLLARNVHRFIALTEFAREKYIEGGFPAERIVVKPNFLMDTDTPFVRPQVAQKRSGALFVGRLSEEKGLNILLDAWESLAHVPLRIAGDGPLREQLLARLPPNVTYLGPLDADAIKQEMARAAMLVVPSTWYEGLPMTIVEAYAAGLPVIASRLGSLAEIVVDGETGFHFEPNSPADLAKVIKAFDGNDDVLANLSRRCRAYSQDQFSAKANLEKLMQIYNDAIAMSHAER